jgi:hypothetical protein
MGQRDGQMGIVSVRPDAPTASHASANPVHRPHPIAAFVKRKGRKHIFMQFFHVFMRAGSILLLISSASCNRGTGNSGESPAPLPYPELQDVEAVVREVRALLPALPSSDAHPPALPRLSAADRLPRLVLAGEGRLLRTRETPPLPAALRVELFLDGNDPPGGYLSVQAGSGVPERWPILDVQRTGLPDQDFFYIFRVLDKQSRLRYFSLLGLYYGAGALRFRAFEGYLIVPGEGGEVDKRPPVYPVDFGYHWPEPARFLVRLDSLKQESEVLDKQLTKLKALRALITSTQQHRETLATSSVPADQEAKRQQDGAALVAQVTQAEREREALTTDMTARIVRIYLTRKDLAEDWAAFRESNPYRWMTPRERGAAFDRLQPASALRAGWREAHAALDGESIAPLRSAQQAMEQALLRELELRP